MSHQFGFERLQVWQKARRYAVLVCRTTRRFPPEERFGLVVQLNKAAISVASNIAEGSARTSRKDQGHFYEIAYSSLMETLCQLIISHDLDYIAEAFLTEARTLVEEIARMLNSLRGRGGRDG